MKHKPFDSNNFHVAIWHEDLLDLQKQGFIDGVSAITERKWEELRRTMSFNNSPIYIKENGKTKEVKLPSLDEFDNEIHSWPEFHLNHIEVTLIGREYAQIALAHSNLKVSDLGNRIEHLMDLRYFDIAVREACLALEYKIKNWLNSNLWGERLVVELNTRLNSKGEIIKSYLKVFCSQIRMALKFIRNDFMHNFMDIDEIQCKAILCRLARINDQLDEVITNTNRV
ncbi:hypothetical protein ACFLUO_02460 [Chloroflexota bacterium]